jgi:hypothetical protein
LTLVDKVRVVRDVRHEHEREAQGVDGAQCEAWVHGTTHEWEVDYRGFNEAIRVTLTSYHRSRK